MSRGKSEVQSSSQVRIYLSAGVGIKPAPV
jgi:hypothetical protein